MGLDYFSTESAWAFAALSILVQSSTFFDNRVAANSCWRGQPSLRRTTVRTDDMRGTICARELASMLWRAESVAAAGGCQLSALRWVGYIYIHMGKCHGLLELFRNCGKAQAKAHSPLVPQMRHSGVVRHVSFALFVRRV